MWKNKGRGCADIRKKGEYLNKDETSAHNIVTESLMLMCLIDDTEHRHAAKMDIHGEFIQSEMEGETANMKL